MAAYRSPGRNDSQVKAWEMKSRLEKCWALSLNWSLYPKHLKDGCEQLGRALDMPPDAIISGLLLLVSFFMSHCAVEVPDTMWIEPAILWITITMPTGSGKTPLFTYLTGILQRVRQKLNFTHAHPPWLLDEASIEKMGELMATNHSKLLGMYDELSTFLAQINVYRGKGLTDSHELSTFLSLYNGKSWTRATVSGDANFHMERTALTVGGFTQPSVSKALIELPSSVEKGFAQRFLWIFPQPSFSNFSTLELVNEKFSEYLVERLASLWRNNSTDVLRLTLPKDCRAFHEKYDAIQEKIKQISVLDELLAGMLSKSKGQVLRLSAAFHVLFCDTDIDLNEEGMEIEVGSVSTEIADSAIVAAQNFVDTCCQHAAFIAGRNNIDDEIIELSTGDKPIPSNIQSTSAFCLLLPGKNLHLSTLLAQKKFRHRGNKEGALNAFRALESAGLGKLKTEEKDRGAAEVYVFEKADIDQGKLDAIAVKLSQFGVSLTQYQKTLQQKDIVKPSSGSKRSGEDIDPPLRRSPRKNN